MGTIAMLSKAIERYKESPNETQERILRRVAEDFARKCGHNKEAANQVLARNGLQVKI